MILVKNLRKYYGKTRGIEDISFSISPGEIYGLIGPNGAGKTTTIRVLTGFLRHDTGEAQIGEFSIPRELGRVKNRLGYLPGEVNYYPALRVKQFLEYNRSFYPFLDPQVEQQLAEELQLDTSKRFKELSMGNKKKVGIYQALVHQPDFLVLDEPTNGLDPLLQQTLYSLLERQRAKGCTILFSSHNLAEVERICDRVGIVRKGKIVLEASIEQLKKWSRRLVTVWDLHPIAPLQKEFDLVVQSGKQVVFSLPPEKIKTFLGRLAQCHFSDLSIRQPTLEETFMEYYREGGPQE
ncbi:MAG TPA: ABC transporter ATP-binding protein [Thermotogota bacterium]|nr:ABC transporter ATP-binding protein [Thermotogota bacterium]HRW92632.1 ABC transporter ATP-binding protein [Thermotogota bacterium]